MQVSKSSSQLRAKVAFGIGVGIASTATFTAACDPVEAFHSLWIYVSTGRKDAKVRENMQQEVRQIRDEFQLKNVDVNRFFLLLHPYLTNSLFERFYSLSKKHNATISKPEMTAVRHSSMGPD